MSIRILLVAAAAALAPLAQAGGAAPVAPKPYYYWLHPKLGMVKVDRATNAILIAPRARAQ
jgi:hypothetical protein